MHAIKNQLHQPKGAKSAARKSNGTMVQNELIYLLLS